MAEGTWEKVWTHRRSKAPLLGRGRGGGVDIHRNLSEHVCTQALRALSASGAGYVWREATCQAMWRPGSSCAGYRWQGSHVWAKDSGGLSATWCRLCDLQVAGTDSCGPLEARGRHGLAPLGACEWAPPVAPITSGVSKKKKKKKKKGKKKRGHCNQAPHVIALRSLGTHSAFSCHWKTLWAVPQTLDHCLFPGIYNWEQLVQKLMWRLNRMGCFLHGLKVVGADHHSYH